MLHNAQSGKHGQTQDLRALSSRFEGGSGLVGSPPKSSAPKFVWRATCEKSSSLFVVRTAVRVQALKIWCPYFVCKGFETRENSQNPGDPQADAGSTLAQGEGSIYTGEGCESCKTVVTLPIGYLAGTWPASRRVYSPTRMGIGPKQGDAWERVNPQCAPPSSLLSGSTKGMSPSLHLSTASKMKK